MTDKLGSLQVSHGSVPVQVDYVSEHGTAVVVTLLFAPDEKKTNLREGQDLPPLWVYECDGSESYAGELMVLADGTTLEVPVELTGRLQADGNYLFANGYVLVLGRAIYLKDESL